MQTRMVLLVRGVALAAGLIAGLLCSSIAITATDPILLVLNPQLREPYAKIFATIISGIERKAGRPTKVIELSDDPDISELRTQINGSNSVIALGSRGLAVVKNLNLDNPVVVGALFLNPAMLPESLVGVSLTPDPARLFERLRVFAPKTKLVGVVYQPATDQWLIDRAHSAAKEHGLRLSLRKADTLRDAAVQYKSLMGDMAKKNGAVWLLQNGNILDDNTLLPYVLREAWDKELVVFSSNPNHVRKGALFSVFPDNALLGEQLAELVGRISQQRDGAETNVHALQHIRTAVNSRAAEHLDLRIDYDDQRFVNVVFPRQ